MRSLASLLLPKWSSDLKYGPCPPAGDLGSRDFLFITSISYFLSSFFLLFLFLFSSCVGPLSLLFCLLILSCFPPHPRHQWSSRSGSQSASCHQRPLYDVGSSVRSAFLRRLRSTRWFTDEVAVSWRKVATVYDEVAVDERNFARQK